MHQGHQERGYCHLKLLISVVILLKWHIHWGIEEETKAMVAEIEDEANDEGYMFTQPRKLSDRVPQPSANEAAAGFDNGCPMT